MLQDQPQRPPLAIRYRSALWRLRRLRSFAAAICLVLIAARIAAPDTTDEITVAVAARDLRAGHSVAAEDVRKVAVPLALARTLGLVPADAANGYLSTDLPANSVLTDAIVRGESAADLIPPGKVGVVITATNAAIADVAQPWTRVDVLTAQTYSNHPGDDATADSGTVVESGREGAVRVATGALVLPWPLDAPRNGAESDPPPGSLFLAVDSAEIEQLAGIESHQGVIVVMVTAARPGD